MKKKFIFCLLIATITIMFASISVSAETNPFYIPSTSDIPVSSIVLNCNSAALDVGQTITIKATVYPFDATAHTVTYSTSNGNVATVYTTSGLVTAKGNGTAIITASCGGYTASCTITVNKEDYSKELYEKSSHVDNSATTSFVQSIQKFFNDSILMFGATSGALTNSEKTFYYVKSATIVDMLQKIFLPISYLLTFIIWCIGIGKRGLELDLYNPKEFLKGLFALLGALIFITMSYEILQLIYYIADGITVNIIDATSTTTLNIMLPLDYSENSTFIIGPLLTLMNILAVLPTALLYSLLNMIIAFIIEIVLCIRLIKIAIYQGVSSIFFAFIAGGKDTSQYVKSFMIEYVTVVFQAVIIAVVYSVYQIAYASQTVNSSGDFVGQSFYPIIMITLGIMVLGSDKIVKRLLPQA